MSVSLPPELHMQDRQRVADRWLGGNGRAAVAVFGALPYSATPGWDDVEAVLAALEDYGLLVKPRPVSPYWDEYLGRVGDNR